VKTVLEVIDLASGFLKEKGIKNSKREATDLLSSSLGLRPLDLYVQYDRPLQETELENFRSGLRRRAKGEPYQYICGETEFYGCRLEINKDVLIPRQETEILVDKIVSNLASADLEGKVLWDLCCGSGCIGITLKKALPALTVVLSDVSDAALEIAKRNAIRNDVDVEFVKGDFLTPFIGRQTDIIVCNPPYVSEEEFVELEPEVRSFEPKLALVAPDGGLAFYRRLSSCIHQYIRPGGQLWLELGYRQGNAVCELFTAIPACQKKLLQDWSGHDRFFFLEME
jgi:release factor glutamine methyltransferase